MAGTKGTAMPAPDGMIEKELIPALAVGSREYPQSLPELCRLALEGLLERLAAIRGFVVLVGAAQS